MDNSIRLFIGLLILLLILPTGISALTHEEFPHRSVQNQEQSTTDDVTFVSTQGKEVVVGKGVRLVAFDTKTKTPIWIHNKYTDAYYDVDPLNNSTILFVAGNGSSKWYAVVMNWRENVVYDRFEVPSGTHDIDYLGEGLYVIADKRYHRTYIYDRTNDTIIWQYNFTDHFPPEAGGGGGYSGDYTHLNDVDIHANGSRILVSPRNFDRVFLINRSTKQIEWTLGEEDNYEILFEQHNPVLLNRSPATVLVADSENDRVIEYRRSDQDWEIVWEFRGKLNWPRDADRLPNGNTLIVDARGDRVLEVTPSRDIVWELRIAKFPYDVERVSLGDEPAGPSMVHFADEFEQARTTQHQDTLLIQFSRQFEWAYDMSQWVLPWWISKLEFGLLILGIGLGLTWSYYEGGNLYKESWSYSIENAGFYGQSYTARIILLSTVGGSLMVGSAIGLREFLSIISLESTPYLDIKYLNPFDIGLSLLLIFQTTRLVQLLDDGSSSFSKILSTIQYFVAIGGIILAMKAFQIYLDPTTSGTRPYFGIGLVLVVFCIQPFIEMSRNRFEVPLSLRLPLRVLMGILVMLMGSVVLFLGVGAVYPFGTFAGPGLMLFAIGRSRLITMETERENRQYGLIYLLLTFRYLLEIISVTIIFVIISLVVGLGGVLTGVVTLEVIGFGMLFLGYLVTKIYHGSVISCSPSNRVC